MGRKKKKTKKKQKKENTNWEEMESEMKAIQETRMKKQEEAEPTEKAEVGEKYSIVNLGQWREGSSKQTAPPSIPISKQYPTNQELPQGKKCKYAHYGDRFEKEE